MTLEPLRNVSDVIHITRLIEKLNVALSQSALAVRTLCRRLSNSLRLFLMTTVG